MGAFNELIELAEAFPHQRRAMMELRADLEIVVAKPQASVADIGTVINEFVKNSSSAAHIGPIPEASVFAAYPQLQVKVVPPPKAEVPKRPADGKGEQAKKGETAQKAGPAGKGASRPSAGKGGDKPSRFLPPDEYEKMLSDMSSEERAEYDQDRDIKAMRKVNSCLQRLGVDAKQYLVKSTLADGRALCHLKRTGTGRDIGIAYIDKSIYERMDQGEKNALRRVVDASFRHHKIVKPGKPKTKAEQQKQRVMYAARSIRSGEAQFDDLSEEEVVGEGGIEEDEGSNFDSVTSDEAEHRRQALEQALAEQRHQAELALADQRRQIDEANQRFVELERKTKQAALEEAARKAAEAAYEQKRALIEEQHRLELERVRKDSDRRAQTSGQAYLTSVPSQFNPMGHFGPQPAQFQQQFQPHFQPHFQPRRGAEEAYWGSGAGGGGPPPWQQMQPQMLPHFQPPFWHVPMHGQFPVQGQAEEALSNLDDESDSGFGNLDEERN